MGSGRVGVRDGLFSILAPSVTTSGVLPALDHTMKRRTFLQRAVALPIGLSPASRRLLGAAVSSYAEQHPDMLVAYLAGRLNQLDAEWDRKRNEIQTAEDLSTRNAYVREKLVEMLGGLPEKDALHPVVTRTLVREGYRIESVLFDSRPDFQVTGNIYLPTGGDGPVPAVVAPGGGHELGRLDPAHQLACLNLVRGGFAVLAFDTIGEGERRHYWNPSTRASEFDDPRLERVLPGGLLLLAGEHLAQYHVWDGMRAVDYLLTREEVDPERIGCVGHSLGGYVALLVGVLDERIACVVASEGGTYHHWPVERSAALDAPPIEQVLIPAAIHGLDIPDLHAAIAPRPLLALTDHSSPRFEAAVSQIRAAYALADAAERFGTDEADDPHGWTVKLRLATTDWFSRWFYDRTGPAMEPDLVSEPPDALYATPNGSLRYARRGHTVFSFLLNKQQQAGLPPTGNPPADLAAFATFHLEIDRQMHGLLHYGVDSDHDLAVHHRMTTPRKRYRVQKEEFLSEDGIYVPAWVFVPEGGDGPFPAGLFVSDRSIEAHGMEFGLLEKLVQRGHLVVAVDVRGVGATRPRARAAAAEAEAALTHMGWSMGGSLLGMRVRDIVRGIDYVLERNDVEKSGIRIRILGRGEGALWALFAAALDARVRGVVADRGLLSYESLLRVDRHRHGTAVLIPGVLERFDLPQVAASIADRHLVILDPLDPDKKPADIRLARHTYEWTRRTYANLGAEARFQLMARQPGSDPADAYLAFLDTWRGG